MPGIREFLYHRLAQAQECLEANPPSPCAEPILDEISQRTDLSAYEANVVLLLQALRYSQSHDNKAAMRVSQNLLRQPELRPGSHRWARRMLAELYFREKRYRDALSAVDSAISFEAEPSKRRSLYKFRTRVVDAMSGKRQIADQEELESVVAEIFDAAVVGYHCRFSTRRGASFNQFTGESSVTYQARGSACEVPVMELERRGSLLRIHFSPLPEAEPRPPPKSSKPAHFDLIQDVVE